LIAQLSTAVEPAFARDAVMSYVEMQQRFLAGDWQPTELDAGRLCEAVSRAVLQLDTGTVTHSDLPAAIRDQLLSKRGAHKLDDKDRYHISKAIEVVYKFRSDRGAVHISPTHVANQIDSVFVMHVGKWILAEFLRLAWNADRDAIGRVIEQLAQLEHSVVHELDGKPLVLSTAVSIPEEILLLLHHAPGNRLTRREIHEYTTNRSTRGVNGAIQSLMERKEARAVPDGSIVIILPGQNRVMREIIPRLTGAVS
jgi:hypothetical protein